MIYQTTKFWTRPTRRQIKCWKNNDFGAAFISDGTIFIQLWKVAKVAVILFAIRTGSVFCLNIHEKVPYFYYQIGSVLTLFSYLENFFFFFSNHVIYRSFIARSVKKKSRLWPINFFFFFFFKKKM